MQFKKLKEISFHYKAPIKKVLKVFNKTAIITENKGFGLVIDDKNKCIGVISDGDIRNKIVLGLDINSPVKDAMNKNYVFVKDSDNHHTILRQFDKKITNLPVLDENGFPIDLYQYSKFLPSTRIESKIIRARVPVRISYSGGGTDFSNYINTTRSEVLSSTINKYCTASVIVRDDNKINIRSKDLNINYTANSFDQIKFGDKLDLIKAAIKIMEPNYGFDLETYAEFLPGTGLGGSSALVVAVLGALNYFQNENQLDIYQLSDLAYQVERIDMKISGGWQDQYATAFGGFNWIEFRKNEVIVNPIHLRRETLLELEYNLMLFKLGNSRSSSDIQNTHNKNISRNKSLFKKMNSLTILMKDALLKGDVKLFADLLHRSWLIKKKMNAKVTNKLVDDCYNAAKKLGALGGKLLGAGESGYLLLYVSPLHQLQVRKALKEKGVHQEMFKFDQNGLEVWSTRR